MLRRTDVEELLSMRGCLDAVEEVFRLQGQGKIPDSEILGVKAPNGGLHVKAGLLPHDQSYIVAKLNTNFPGNKTQSRLPTIQGLIVLYDAKNGRPLAILDSIDITIKRTAAASAVAAKYLARKNSSVATICGCGEQGRAQLRAMRAVLLLEKIYAFDLDDGAATSLAAELSRELKIDIEPTRDLVRAIQRSDVCITCTTAREFFLRKEDVALGTFIAAVGADDTHKQEIDPALMASAKVVADSREQCCTIGDTHHAIAQGLMRKEDVYAELSEIVAGHKPGRAKDDEIIIFDSTGVAIEDAVAAAAVYKRARAASIGSYFEFAA
ncbi:MAG TPA: ornithine cyclodeaminase family protein [Chthoniobacterales bacterium]|nr:ornithine cyclodeaminase family protein [Chthoniobacterales bacterium]